MRTKSQSGFSKIWKSRPIEWDFHSQIWANQAVDKMQSCLPNGSKESLIWSRMNTKRAKAFIHQGNIQGRSLQTRNKTKKRSNSQTSTFWSKSLTTSQSRKSLGKSQSSAWNVAFYSKPSLIRMFAWWIWFLKIVLHRGNNWRQTSLSCVRDRSFTTMSKSRRKTKLSTKKIDW